MKRARRQAAAAAAEPTTCPARLEILSSYVAAGHSGWAFCTLGPKHKGRHLAVFARTSGDWRRVHFAAGDRYDAEGPGRLLARGERYVLEAPATRRGSADGDASPPVDDAVARHLPILRDDEAP